MEYMSDKLKKDLQINIIDDRNIVPTFHGENGDKIGFNDHDLDTLNAIMSKYNIDDPEVNEAEYEAVFKYLTDTYLALQSKIPKSKENTYQQAERNQHQKVLHEGNENE